MEELIKKRIKVYEKELRDQKLSREERDSRVAVVEELRYILDNMNPASDLHFETYIKTENNKWHFVGWGTMLDEAYCIETKVRGDYIYKTYEWLTGKREEYRYRKGGI